MLISLAKVPHIASGSREKPAPRIRISWEGRIGPGEGATIIYSTQPPRCYTALGQSVPPRPSGSLTLSEGLDEMAPRTLPQCPHRAAHSSRGWGLRALLPPPPPPAQDQFCFKVWAAVFL